MHACDRFLAVLATGLCVVIAGHARSQEAVDRAPRFRESVSLDTDGTVARRLATVEEYRAAGQWEQAAETLVDVMASHREVLVPVAPGRYVNAALYGNLLAASFPPEGLAAYRQRVDVQARQWFAAAKDAHDAAPLREIVRRAFASSVGDDALWRLGERAFEQGDFATARQHWTRLVPMSSVPKDQVPAALDATLQFPDPDFPLPDVLARLVLCSLFEGDFERARQELSDFRSRFPESTGTLTGRTGNLGQILEAVAQEAAEWTFPAEHRSPSTFAGNAERNGIAPPPSEFSGRHWRQPLPSIDVATPLLKPAFEGDEPLSRFPVVFEDVVLVNDSRQIQAWNIRTGDPAWPTGEGDSAVIYPIVPPLPASAPERLVGVPRFTMTVHAGRLYARMGSPVTGRARNELRELTTEIVCLDLARGEGRLVWKVTAAELVDSGNWAFEGSPVVAGNRAWVVLRRNHPQTQFNIACLDNETGQLIWNRRVCTAVTKLGDAQNFISHLLPTLAGDTLFLSTDVGAIAAVDAHEGTLRWVFTYESRRTDQAAVLSDHLQQGLNPCLFDRGLIIAAPNDFDGIVAIDAATGVRRWHRPLKGKGRDLLGVVDGTLVVGGTHLTGLDVHSGRSLWHLEAAGPENAGYGRGAVAGERVFWPKREEIVIVQATGAKAGQPVPGSPLRKPGGNLVVAGDHLLVARPDELVALWEFGDVVEPGLPAVSARPAPALPTVRPAAFTKTRLDRRDAEPRRVAPLPWQRRWERPLPSPPAHAFFLDSTPNADDELLLVQHRELEALRLNDGTSSWKQPIEFPLIWATRREAAVLTATRHDLRAHDVTSGEPLWIVDFRRTALPPWDETSESSRPVQFTLAGDRIVRFDPAGTLEAMDADTGARLWQASDFGERLNPHWFHDGRRIVVQTAGHHRIAVVNAETGRVSFSSQDRSAAWRAAPVPAGDELLAVVGAARVSAFRPDDADAGWTYRGAISRANALPRLLADGSHLVLLIDGDTAAKLSTTTGEPLWTIRIARQPLAEPARSVTLADGRLFAAADGILRAYTLDDGHLLWEAPLGDRERSWTVQPCGPAVAVWAAVRGEIFGVLALCDVPTGRRIQDFTLPLEREPLALHVGSRGAIVVARSRLIGLAPFGPPEP